MKSFSQFIQEEYHSLFKGSPIFINPSKADIIEIGKTAEHESARFLAVASTNSVFVWDADKFIHDNALNFLQSKGVIPSDKRLTNYNEFFAGTALIKAGQLIYYGSDEMDFYIDQYSKSENAWRYNAVVMAKFLSTHSLSLHKTYSFVNRYIHGLDGPNNPFLKINDLLQKK